MKIDQRTQSAPVGEAGSTSAASGPARGLSGGAAAGDTVELSGPLRVLRSSASDRANLLGRLTKSIQAGTYSVSAQSVSRALIQETLAGVAG